MSVDEMGPGPKSARRPLRMHVAMGDERWPLISGEHPHSMQPRTFYAVIGDPDQPEAVPFNGHLRPTKVEVVEGNYWKASDLSGDEIRKSCALVVHVRELEDKTLDWVKVLEMGFREAKDAMIWWLANEHKLNEHYVDWWRKSERDAIKGKKVLWKDQPAIVTRWEDDGMLYVVPDGIERFRDEYGDGGAWAKDDIFTPHLSWGRE